MLDFVSVDWALVLTVASSVTTLGVFGMVFLLMRRLRQAVAAALGETAGHQVRTAKRLAETIEQIQKNQQLLEQQVHSLFLLYRQMRQDVNAFADHEDTKEDDTASKGSGTKILH